MWNGVTEPGADKKMNASRRRYGPVIRLVTGAISARQASISAA